MTDAVRGKLDRLPGLQVIASSSSSQYKGTTKTPQQIGQELGVQYLLVGTVRWEKSDGHQPGAGEPRAGPGRRPAPTRWQQPFDAAITDVFQVQADIAGRWPRRSTWRWARASVRRWREKPTQNLAAYDAFLKGEEVSATARRS